MMNLAELEQSSRTVVFKQYHFIYPHDIDYLEFILNYDFAGAQLYTPSNKELVEELKKPHRSVR